ncbi:MAG: hypothetical protein M1835_002774 [Candelina submexicana]|nr:MAG: hypothetical protein M1835_002774 [Candelina submexicana]
MSYEFDLTDFVTVPNLAWQVYRSCRAGPDNFKALAGDVASMRVALKQIEGLIADDKLDRAKESDLGKLGHGCSDVLTDLDALLEDHDDQDSSGRKSWDRLRLDLSEIRSRLVYNTTLLNSFNDNLVNSAQESIEEALHQLLIESQAGKRDGSIFLTTTVESAWNGDEGTWRKISQELESVGIPKKNIGQNHPLIISWITNAINDGCLEARENTIRPSTSKSSAPLIRKETTSDVQLITSKVTLLLVTPHYQIQNPSDDFIGDIHWLVEVLLESLRYRGIQYDEEPGKLRCWHIGGDGIRIFKIYIGRRQIVFGIPAIELLEVKALSGIPLPREKPRLSCKSLFQELVKDLKTAEAHRSR